MAKSRWKISSWCAALTLLLGCAGELDEPGRFAFLAGDGGSSDGGAHAAPAPKCVTDFFESRCDSSICHGSGSLQVNLVSPNVQDRLVDQPSSKDGKCKDRTLVPSTGGESLLMEKLTAPTCGDKMPLVGTATDAEIQCVRDWVEGIGGANPTEDGGT